MTLIIATPALAVVVPVPVASPSDHRAAFHSGNVSTCAGAGFGSDVQLGAEGTTGAADANVSGTVRQNAGTVQTGQGQELNVAIQPGAQVIIDAVVVKGSDGFNVYSNPSFLPPALQPPQHYISPLTGGGNVPNISHWFVCYRFSAPLATGTLTLTKQVIAPEGRPAAPPPGGYTALVNCDDGNPAHQNVLVTFGEGGGEGMPVLTGLAAGTVCTVVEQNTGSLPPGTVVRYEPPGADGPGVTIGGGNGVIVNIVNDFSGVAVEHGEVRIVKVVRKPTDVRPPAHFTARVACNDGTLADVTLPGHGGLGSPVVRPEVGFDCALGENPVPAGWTVRYSVNGGPPTATLPVFSITSATVPVTVTLTDQHGPSKPARPSKPTKPSIPAKAPETGTAAVSGDRGQLLMGGGAVLALAGHNGSAGDRS